MKKNTIKMFINELVKITKNKSKSLHEPNFSGEEIKLSYFGRMENWKQES